MTRTPLLSFTLIAASVGILAVTVMSGGAAAAQAATTPTKKTLKVKVKIRTPVSIGGTRLRAETYVVKIMPVSGNPSESMLQFSETVYKPNEAYLWGTSAWREHVVLTILASAREVSAPATRTALVFSSSDSSKVIGLDIRGSSTEYVFGANAQPAMDQQ